MNQNFLRDTKRWGKFEFRPIVVATHEFLTAVGNITLETVSWTIYIDEIRSAVYLYDLSRTEPDRLCGYTQTSITGYDLRSLYKCALRQVSDRIAYWKREATHHQKLLQSANRACGKCAYAKSYPTCGGEAREAYGPITTMWMDILAASYRCHRYPKTVEVTTLNECGEFQGKSV